MLVIAANLAELSLSFATVVLVKVIESMSASKSVRILTCLASMSLFGIPSKVFLVPSGLMTSVAQGFVSHLMIFACSASVP